MRDPAFWWRDPPAAGIASRLLAPLAGVYGKVAAARLGRAGARAAVPVICVGNLTLGGGGKTPTAIALARLQLAAGRRPVFLSRGYGGRLRGPALVAADGDAETFGDEPLLLARVAPTMVARDRVAGAKAAVAAGAEVIIMDDGLQNPSLEKDAALLALDGRRGIGNGRVFPAGPLRAPVEPQLDRVHAVLLIGEAGRSAHGVVQTAGARGLPIFTAHIAPDQAALARLRAGPVLAYAGIADPQKFFDMLTREDVTVVATHRFPDHHRYRTRDAEALLAAAAAKNLQLVTTEKDAARLACVPDLAALARQSIALPVSLLLDNADALQTFLRGRGIYPPHCF